MVGRGGGDRKDKLPNKACALYALQLPAPANRNKRNKAVKLSDFEVRETCCLPFQSSPYATPNLNGNYPQTAFNDWHVL
jgi:hypothetical protein